MLIIQMGIFSAIICSLFVMQAMACNEKQEIEPPEWANVGDGCDNDAPSFYKSDYEPYPYYSDKSKPPKKPYTVFVEVLVNVDDLLLEQVGKYWKNGQLLKKPRSGRPGTF